MTSTEQPLPSSTPTPTSIAPPVEGGPNLHQPSLYANRELSWLAFNARVLAMAERADVPPLERLRFAAIASSNLDEFYMVRVASLRNQAAGRTTSRDPNIDGRRPADVLREIGDEAKAMSLQLSTVLTHSILPELKSCGVRFFEAAELSESARARLGAYYQREVHPCLTPIAIDPAHPFPHLRNKSLNLALRIEAKARTKPVPGLEQPEGRLLALVQVPSVLPRFVPLEPESGERYAFMPLETVIALHASDLFPGHRIIEACPFRVTRAADIEIDEEEAENLLTSIQDELRRRDRGEAVRLELASTASEELLDSLRDMLGIESQHVHRHPGFLATSDLHSVLAVVDMPELSFEPFTPQPSPALRLQPNIFRTLAEHDVMLHHPYESFAHIVEFVETAADDPDVVAIKMTLYRAGGDSPIVRALARAAQNGKQVTVLVELKARFDEAANIAWARALEEGGVHVVYGLLGLKTHSKLMLVMRREGGQLKRYLHVSTGNYNPSTARVYTDISLLTARDDLTNDALLLFNVLTGYGDLPPMQRLIVAPFTLRQHLVEMIAREVEHARAGRPARITAKLNALVDGGIIRALYRASQAGVEIDLLVRGICCLKPGVPGVSERIRVRAIVDRFLEHARIFYWANGGEEEVYLSSADWMPRNLNRRIEVCVPVLDPTIKRRLKDEVMRTELADRSASWTLDADSRYRPASPDPSAEPVRAQSVFISLARERSLAARTTVRREFAARSPSGAFSLSPTMRAAQAAARRRRPPGV
jgi:polyphosphate kinase